MRKADPAPALCSACGNSSDADSPEYVDFEAAYDGPVVLDEHGMYRHSPNGEPSASENIYICFVCLRNACEIVGLKPELHRRQLNEIRRLEIENAHWRDLSQSLRAQANRALDPLLGEPSAPVRRGPGRPRKVEVG